MPPRFSYWTIIAGGLPTAFRAADREELLPTFTRLKQKQPDAEMKWFARGKLWTSPEEARQHNDRRGPQGAGRSFDGDGRRPARPAGPADQPREKRGRDWRPGGEHRDPRQPFKDAKKARNQRFKADKFARRTTDDRPDHAPRERPHGNPLPHRGNTEHQNPKGARPSGPAATVSSQAPRGKPHGDQRMHPPHADRERERRPPSGRRDGPGRDDWRSNTGGDGRGTHRTGGQGNNRPFTPRGDWSGKAPRGKPHGDQRMHPPRAGREREHAPAGDRPNGPKREDWRSPTGGNGRDTERARGQGNNRPFTPRGDWSGKAPRGKPHGDQPVHPPHADRERERHSRVDRRDNTKPEHWRSNAGGASRGTPRGAGHGDNRWKPKPPRQASGPGQGPRRPFTPGSFNRDRVRGADQEETPPARPRGPNREPKPSERPEPSAPPRPSEPVTAPPGPPERGRLNRNKRRG